MIRWVLMTGTALSLLAMPAMAQQAQDGSQGPNRVSLTIYNQNVALVEDVRELTLPAGRSRR